MIYSQPNRAIPLMLLLLLLLVVTGCASVIGGKFGASLDRENGKLKNVPVDSLFILDRWDLLVVNTVDQRRIRGHIANAAVKDSLTLSPRTSEVPGHMETVALKDIERIQRLETYHGYKRVGFVAGLTVDIILWLYIYLAIRTLTSIQ